MEVRKVRNTKQSGISKKQAETAICAACLDLIGKHSSSNLSRCLALSGYSYHHFFRMIKMTYFEIKDFIPSDIDARLKSLMNIKEDEIKKYDEEKESEKSE